MNEKNVLAALDYLESIINQVKANRLILEEISVDLDLKDTEFGTVYSGNFSIGLKLSEGKGEF